ncbi:MULTISPECIES: glutamyl-tRNA reductase [unclassified Campylobacter]|uniref:glutamyl-tRNA reductase n=1 Tax=unclassified Campylobacter TaxID=2593542 RepID=UPI001BDA6EE9|nr:MULTISPECIES: glutamyl-tRNA reductase [unclassified Campylobacter]MBZ7980110.1 glutamyl-tRNA reductase [Campylobacter sp. RM12642]MBZ7984213.1 glutamyl-tRNA reductase [Campylobacter sp. RM12647]MBT0878417.1 glutamyl-tRNA reductase [Campylobacter sp. 2018MI01]MBT0880661.1 glutamyl-tRNA reductase [Campylobacter sp. 2018MI27]MBT0884893.1 glutamyl-tRNA reductase [Campylobacter sp. 2018MI10]
MHYFSVSFTHKNTSIEVRERLALSDEFKKKEIYKLILANDYIEECVILSTCNRIEIMCYIENQVGVYEYIIKCLCLICKIDEQLIKNSPDIYEGSGFIHHLFSVSSSLDSLVIGETQITGQLKQALQSANYSPNLEVAINYSFKCAAMVRNKTAISKNSVSVSSVAVAKAREICDIKTKKILLIGSGLMIELAAKHLLNHTKGNIAIISRTKANALKLANELDLICLDYEDLISILNSYELIFCATSSNEPIITKDIISPVEFKRYFFDIAVPRDIELENSELIEVFSVDSLNEIVKKNMQFKDEEAKIAFSVVAKMVNEFYKDLNVIQVTPIIKAMRIRADEIINQELAIAIKKGYLKNSDNEEALKFAKQVMKSYLHEPTIRLKNIDDEGLETQSLNYLFNVKENE